MRIDLLDLASFGLLAGGVAMIGVAFWASRWQLAAFRFEREVMFIAALGMGPLASLLRTAIPLDPDPYEMRSAYLETGMILLVLQTLFWSAFVRLRKHRKAEQAILKAADA